MAPPSRRTGTTHEERRTGVGTGCGAARGCGGCRRGSSSGSSRRSWPRSGRAMPRRSGRCASAGAAVGAERGHARDRRPPRAPVGRSPGVRRVHRPGARSHRARRAPPAGPRAPAAPDGAEGGDGHVRSERRGVHPDRARGGARRRARVRRGRTALAPHWNALVALGAALFVLALAARGVARRLAWPLEDVADAAERFGGGDLTARTRLGGRRRWVADEVRGVAQAFDQMADRIARVVRDQRELLAAISHELRSPLGRARVALEIARERGGEGAAASIDDIERQLTDVDAILGDLLAAARAGLSDVKPVATPVAAWLRARLAAEPAPPAIELASDDARRRHRPDRRRPPQPRAPQHSRQRARPRASAGPSDRGASRGGRRPAFGSSRGTAALDSRRSSCPACSSRS